MCISYQLKDLSSIQYFDQPQFESDSKFVKAYKNSRANLKYLGSYNINLIFDTEGKKFESQMRDIYLDANSVPFFMNEYYMGNQKDSGIDTYYFVGQTQGRNVAELVQLGGPEGDWFFKIMDFD